MPFLKLKTLFLIRTTIGLSDSSPAATLLSESGFVFRSDSATKPDFLGERVDIRLTISTRGSVKYPRLSFDEALSPGCGSAIDSDLGFPESARGSTCAV